MRRYRDLVAVALLVPVLGALACKSDQPTQNTTQAVRLSFDLRGLNSIWDCWDTASTSSGLYCEERLDGGTPNLVNRQIPWRYSLEVSVLPAGSVNEVVVASSASDPPVDAPADFQVFGNQTAFDETSESGRVCPALATPCSDYSRPRSVSQGSRDATTYNQVDTVEPNILGQPDGCPGGASCGLEIKVSKGDTIIVRARKNLRQNAAGVVQNFQDPELTLTGQLSINGVAAGSLGTTSSDVSDGSGVVFSYTVR